MLGSTLDERARHGNTCLHITWMEAGFRGLDWDRIGLFMFTYHLLDIGADANALNDSNETPSDMVFYQNQTVLYKIWDLALYVKGIKVDDLEVKKQTIRKRDGIDFRIPPLSGRDVPISEHDWLERVWSDATGWGSARKKGTELDRTEAEEFEADEEEEETRETESEEAEVEVEAEEEEVPELSGTGSNEVELTPKQPSSILYTLWDFW